MLAASTRPFPTRRAKRRGPGVSNSTSGIRRESGSCKAGLPRRMGSETECERKKLAAWEFGAGSWKLARNFPARTAPSRSASLRQRPGRIGSAWLAQEAEGYALNKENPGISYGG